MTLRKTVSLMKFGLSLLFLVGMTAAGAYVSPRYAQELDRSLVLDDSDNEEGLPCRCLKVAAGAKEGTTCTAPAFDAQTAQQMEKGLDFGSDIKNRQVAVSTLVGQALKDQREMLQQRVSELQRWNSRDQAAFAKWFGTTSEEARQLIHKRVLRVLELNANYSVENFRRAKHRPNVYAYVYPTQPSKVFLDDMFVEQDARGENSRAGTITHEMSHFEIIGGTKDHTYGPAKCRQLARTNSEKALNNADNFEYWAEQGR